MTPVLGEGSVGASGEGPSLRSDQGLLRSSNVPVTILSWAAGRVCLKGF